jgi:hypothetical protein
MHVFDKPSKLVKYISILKDFSQFSSPSSELAEDCLAEVEARP